MPQRSARPAQGSGERGGGAAGPPSRRGRAFATGAVLAALLLAHHDVWLWDAPHRLAWAGGLPAGLVYHVAYCVAAALVMIWTVRRFPWSRLDRSDRGPGGAPP